jgi:hypothetical protein
MESKLMDPGIPITFRGKKYIVKKMNMKQLERFADVMIKAADAGLFDEVKDQKQNFATLKGLTHYYCDLIGISTPINRWVARKANMDDVKALMGIVWGLNGMKPDVPKAPAQGSLGETGAKSPETQSAISTTSQPGPLSAPAGQ